MGLEMQVVKILDTTVLENHTIHELRAYKEKHYMLQDVNIRQALIREIEQKELRLDEVKEVVKRSGIFFIHNAETPQQYCEYLLSDIDRLNDRLNALPELPPEFKELPPVLETENSKYWAKANAVHGWFVRNAQIGIESGKEYEIPYEVLKKLQQTITLIMNEKKRITRIELAKEFLPPTEGDGFGSYEIDKSYFYKLKETLKWLNHDISWERLKDGDVAYTYTASW